MASRTTTRQAIHRVRCRRWPTINAVILGFGQGEELSEHTAAKSAMLFFMKGEATVGLGEDVQEAQGGTWVHMPAGLKHSIKAKTPVVMLLVLLK